MEKRAAGVVRDAGRSINKTKTGILKAEAASEVARIYEAAQKTVKRVKKFLSRSDRASDYSKDELAVAKRELNASKKELNRGFKILNGA